MTTNDHHVSAEQDLNDLFDARRKRWGFGQWAATIAVLVLVAVCGWYVNGAVSDRRVREEQAKKACGDVNSGVQKVDNECVGVTDGQFDFRAAYHDVGLLIRKENDAIGRHAAVTVALLEPFTPDGTSAFNEQQMLHAIEGAYTAQHRYNSDRAHAPDAVRIRLVLANMGGHQLQWKPVVDQLIAEAGGKAPLVAVAGLGASVPQTLAAAKLLSQKRIATIGAVTTADQLDYTTIPGFVRVSPSNQQYVEALKAYLADRPALNSALLVYDQNSETPGNSDLFTSSLRQDLARELKSLIKLPESGYVGSLDPRGARPVVFDHAVSDICGVVRPKVVLFAGRQADLRQFLHVLENRSCRKQVPLTVLVGGTDLGSFRDESKQLRAARITLVYAAATNPKGWQADVAGTPPSFKNFLDAYTGNGFPVDHLPDGHAMSTHDTILTAAEAIRMADLARQPHDLNPPGSATVLSNLLNLNSQNVIHGATGTLAFSQPNAYKIGNPTDKPIPVMQLPPSDAREIDAEQVPGTVYLTRNTK